ncbi:MAG TPA: glycosyltransferase [Elusimicrobiota bacterium]|nr:glycosyltransferase [Elusimicrobiota bacterium]
MRKKIAYFVDTNALGGGEKYVVDLMAAMGKRGHEVLFLCQQKEELAAYVGRMCPGVRIVAARFPSVSRSAAIQAGLAINRRSNKIFEWLKIPGLAVYYLNVLYGFIVLWRLLRRHRPEVLHVSNGGYPAAESHRAAVLAARWVGIPKRVMTVHNMASGYPPVACIEKRLDRWVEGSLHAIISVSQRAKEALAVQRGFDTGHVSVIYNGIVPHRVSEAEGLRRELGIPPGVKVVGNIGGLQPRKGHEALLEAFKKVHAEFPRTVLVIIGEGPCRSALEAQVRAAGLETVVLLPGFRPDAGRYADMMDVFVFPSLAYESFPYVVLEAMSAGRPIVATDVGGTAEQIVDGQCGRLVPAGDVSEMSRAIGRVLSDENTAASWGVAAKKRVEELFTLEGMIEKTEKLYL